MLLLPFSCNAFGDLFWDNMRQIYICGVELRGRCLSIAVGDPTTHDRNHCDIFEGHNSTSNSFSRLDSPRGNVSPGMNWRTFNFVNWNIYVQLQIIRHYSQPCKLSRRYEKKHLP